MARAPPARGERRREDRLCPQPSETFVIDSLPRLWQPDARNPAAIPGRRYLEISDMAEDITDSAQTVAAGQLRSFIERIERLEEEKKTIADDIKEVFAEAKGTGFDTKAMRTLIRLRKKDQAERQEEEAILDLYMAALGMA
jgi:uncharacterized protein (UPF0335 family)